MFLKLELRGVKRESKYSTEDKRDQWPENSKANDHIQKLNVYMYIYVEDRLFLQNFNAISIIEEEVQT